MKRSCLVWLGVALLAFSFSGCATLDAAVVGSPVEWFEGYKMGQYLHDPKRIEKSADIRSALAAPWYGEFAMADGAGVLASCADYLQVKGSALHAVDPTDEAPFMVLTRMCDASAAILEAKPAEQSHLNNIKFDATLPKALPIEFVLVTSVVDRGRLLNKYPRAHWGDVEEITAVETCGAHCAVYSSAGAKQEVRLVARGDFDSDGISDILVSSLDSLEDGTYSALRLFLLTRRQKDGELELLREFSGA